MLRHILCSSSVPDAVSAGQLVGAGDRKKAIVGPIAVNVYAVGLYVDEAGAKVSFTPFSQISILLVHDPAFATSCESVRSVADGFGVTRRLLPLRLLMQPRRPS